MPFQIRMVDIKCLLALFLLHFHGHPSESVLQSQVVSEESPKTTHKKRSGLQSQMCLRLPGVEQAKKKESGKQKSTFGYENLSTLQCHHFFFPVATPKNGHCFTLRFVLTLCRLLFRWLTLDLSAEHTNTNMAR